MSQYLDAIVNVQIDISSPAQSNANFGVMLIVGPAPKDATKTPPDVAVYNGIDEVTDAGWKAIGDGADPVGIAALVAFSSARPPSKIYIAIQKTKDDGLEAITETLDRAKDTDGWWAIAPAGVDESLFNDIAAWTEANGKFFMFTTLSTKNPVTTQYFRTAGIYGKVTPDETDTPVNNQYSHVAMLAVGLSYTPGEETWAFKQLSTIEPSVLKGQDIATLESENLNYYIKVAGKGCTKDGKVIAGEWIDVIRYRDWQVSDMQERVYNLFVTNPKIPFNDGGIGLIENTMIASLKQGQKQGGLDQTAYDDEGTELPGYVTSVPRASNITDQEKAKRVLNNCKFTGRLAGAIHATKIQGNLVYS